MREGAWDGTLRFIIFLILFKQMSDKDMVVTYTHGLWMSVHPRSPVAPRYEA